MNELEVLLDGTLQGEYRLEELYKSIGKSFYEDNRKYPPEGMAEHFNKIEESIRTVSDIFEGLGMVQYEENKKNPPEKYKWIYDEITKIACPEPEKNKCIHCGAVADEDAKFCVICGKPLEEAVVAKEPVQTFKVCPNCGNEIGLDARFCGKCGTKL